jgi:hypothetical protein
MTNSPTVATAIHALRDLKKAEEAWNAAADAGDIEAMRHHNEVLKRAWQRQAQAAASRAVAPATSTRRYAHTG